MKSSADLFEAIQQRDLQKLSLILDESPHLAETRNEQGISAVMLALYYQNQEAVKLLRNTGIELDLWEAAALGDIARAQECLKSKPDSVSTFSPDGFTPLHLAAFFRRSNVVKLLLDRNAEVNLVSKNDIKVMPLHSAVAGGDFEVAKQIVEHEAEVNARQAGGFTPLMGAAQNGDLDLVKLLLLRGADIAMKSDEGKMALDFAPNGEVKALLTTNATQISK
ncbi:ankyrin repeat domain-containing protein [Candidatus Acetothermia bacterium]|nr:ankyrin repeat domain-containing protein [Candidatus Acetothermia bacterium]MBI3643639.1 ankyrin repeat domain-containing protein [Candidatus Acetothermia bacterium]